MREWIQETFTPKEVKAGAAILLLIAVLSLLEYLARCFAPEFLLIMVLLYISLGRRYLRFRDVDKKKTNGAILVHLAAIVLCGVAPLFI